MNPQIPTLTTQSLSFSYGPRPILQNLSLSLNPAKILAILGPNGSGKSTLLRLLLNHLPKKSTQGQITWLNRPLNQWTPGELAKKVAYLPQFPSFEPGQTVHDVLRLGRAPYWTAFGLEDANDESVVQQVAQTLNLSPLLPQPMDHLSGGQRQRVFIGRCLVQQPAALFLDEPSTGLDLRYQVELCHLLQKLAREQSLSVLMASHDLTLMAAVADDLILLNEGKSVAQGPPSQVLTPPLLQSVFNVPMDRIDREGKTPIVVPIIDRH